MDKGLTLKLFLAISIVQLLVAEEVIPQPVKKEFEEAISNTSNPFKKSIFEDIVLESQKFPFLGMRPYSAGFEETKALASELMSIPFSGKDIPCLKEIKNKKDLPPIILVGELHSCPNCHVNMVNRALDVRDKKALLASEGHDYEDDVSECDDINECSRPELPHPLIQKIDPKGAKILGIESLGDTYSSFIEALIELDGKSGSIAADPKNIANEKLIDNEGYGIILGATTYTITNSLLSAASQSLAEKNPNFNKEFYQKLSALRESIISMLTEKNKDDDYTDKIISEVDKFIKTFSYEDLRKHFTLILNESKSLIANDHTPEEKAKRPLFLALLQKENFSLKDLKVFNELVSVTGRNKEFAANALALYCSHAVPKGLPLYVQIGAAHIAGVKYLINNASKDAAITHLPIQVKDEASEFLDMDIEKRKEHLKDGFLRIEQRIHN